MTVASLCAGQLPFADAALALCGIAVGWVACQWWGELACDRAATNRCGRQAAIDCWRQELGLMQRWVTGSVTRPEEPVWS
ncbi:hypothetical protein AB0D07_32645 [Streptomyces globisporus]|uniref:hypothetical protein n=1 Tax=Streptomyces TaxID=1883 RepID=UPI000D1CA4D8|nr:hypothetical protein [Streptomyces sp. st170]